MRHALISTIVVGALCGCETQRGSSSGASSEASSRARTEPGCDGQPTAVEVAQVLEAPDAWEGRYVALRGQIETTTTTRRTLAGARRWARGDAPGERDCLTVQRIVPEEDPGLTRRVELDDGRGRVFCPSRSCEADEAAATCRWPATGELTARGVLTHDAGLMLVTLTLCE